MLMSHTGRKINEDGFKAIRPVQLQWGPCLAGPCTIQIKLGHGTVDNTIFLKEVQIAAFAFILQDSTPDAQPKCSINQETL